MLEQFRQLIRRFASDERGAFLVIFGVMAIVLVATSGAVVDYTAIEQARTRAQVALDSAALGLQPRIYDKPAPSEETLRGMAENVLQERMIAGDIAWSICPKGKSDTLPCVRVDDAAVDIVDGTLRLEASIQLPMAFVSLVGVESMTARLVSEATRKRLNIEVVMVLDNSGSMAQYNRMGHLKAAANCAVNALLLGGCTAGGGHSTIANVKIGIVPFTEFVNVGTANRSATWMDRTGASRVARDNFDNDDYDGNTFAGPINRFALFDQMSNVSWRGCVEARLPPYDTTDDPPDASVPATLFAPALAPDEPDTLVSTWWGTYAKYPNSYLRDAPSSCNPPPRWVWTQTKYGCNKDATDSQSYDSANCNGQISNVYHQVMPNGTTSTTSSTRPASIYHNPDPGSGAYTDTYATISGSGSNRTIQRVRTWVYPYSERELQERMCKYTGNIATNKDGPNVDCPSSQILPLTDNLAQIKSRIGSMNAEGGTNIHQGVMWGFHALSPTDPLTEGNAYNSATSKVMIVMTDGENTHAATNNMNGSWWYTAYGYPFNRRLGKVGDSTDQLQVEMDVRTAATCANAKAAGITIYTIGLSAPNQKTKDLLTRCASSAAKSYFPEDPSELHGVFKEIAEELANLRLAR
jgi:Flp pilus assembly protein TadG